jgi:hypothetical protein
MTRINYILCDRCETRVDFGYQYSVQAVDGTHLGDFCWECAHECLPHSEIVKLDLKAKADVEAWAALNG